MNIEQGINFLQETKRIVGVLIVHEEDLYIEQLYISNIELLDGEICVEYRVIGRTNKDLKRIDYKNDYYVKNKYFDMSNDEIIQDYFGVLENE